MFERYHKAHRNLDAFESSSYRHRPIARCYAYVLPSNFCSTTTPTPQHASTPPQPPRHTPISPHASTHTPRPPSGHAARLEKLAQPVDLGAASGVDEAGATLAVI